jgi:hypothetical protein
MLDGDGTVDAAKKMPVPRSKEDSRTTSEPTSLLRWELISRIISGVKEAARMEDPAGGVSLMPRRVGPWTVCLPLRRRRRREDEEGRGLTGGAASLRAASDALVLSRRSGAATAGAGARFFEAAEVTGGAGWNTLAFFDGCGGTAASCPEDRGRAAFSAGRGVAVGVASRGGGPVCAIIWARATSKDEVPHMLGGRGWFLRWGFLKTCHTKPRTSSAKRAKIGGGGEWWGNATTWLCMVEMNRSWCGDRDEGVGVERLGEEVAGLNGAAAYDSGVVSREDGGKSRAREWAGKPATAEVVALPFFWALREALRRAWRSAFPSSRRWSSNINDESRRSLNIAAATLSVTESSAGPSLAQSSEVSMIFLVDCTFHTKIQKRKVVVRGQEGMLERPERLPQPQ